MSEKVLVRVRLPATQRTYEFWVPHELDAGIAATLMARLLSVREPGRLRADGTFSLMLLEGDGAGCLLDGGRSIRRLVSEGVLVNGSSLALV